MAKKVAKKKSKRNYRSEYDNYHSSDEQKKNRAGRNKTRREALKDGRVTKGDGMDMHHKDGNPRNTSKSNTRVMKKGTNRAKK